ncbi:MAG: hypothetical protein Q3980_01155 [Turicibacter sp.]|nr:hypothetical protein [Turicibacter sp.]
MFKIDKLVMKSNKGEEYTYQFDYGINYFKGKNSSGKTEFYKFLDYMLGASENISEQYWYKDTLKEARMEIVYENINYILIRTLDPEVNYFSYKDEEVIQPIGSVEYKDKLNSIFMKDNNYLKELREFTDENLTYRTFTMFNFLGEKRQGVLNDFLDKCSDVKYSVKLNSILNFIFNKNLSNIFLLIKELEELEDEIKQLEKQESRFDFIYNRINNNLLKLNIKTSYTGKNSFKIKEEISKLKQMDNHSNNGEVKTIAELEVIFNNLDEQVKIYENRISDSRRMKKESEKKKVLLNKLETMICNTNELEYLIDPIIKLVLDLENSISFNKYIINDSTIKEIKKQRELVKEEILRANSRFQRFSMDDKVKALAIIEDYLNEDINYNEKELIEKRKRRKQIKSEIKILQNADDVERINSISNYITSLYKSAYEVSALVKNDVDMDGFQIQYFKKGNILQPMIINREADGEKLENYYTGSMARHTLIQLSGYLSFLKLLITEDKYPLIPILVIDHISKPFDSKNRQAIGVILEKFYESIDKKSVQIFMFDDESNEDLLIKNALVYDLISPEKSGFNPFYIENESI